MLTVGELFMLSGQDSGADLVQYLQVKPLSIASAIRAYEKQRRIYFVTLISPQVLMSGEVKTVDDISSVGAGPLGQMTQTEVQALASALEENGVYLRYVDKNLRTATMIGTVANLEAIAAVPLTNATLLPVLDEISAGYHEGETIMIVGGATIAVGIGAKIPPLVAIGIIATFIGAFWTADTANKDRNMKPSSEKKIGRAHV